MRKAGLLARGLIFSLGLGLAAQAPPVPVSVPASATDTTLRILTTTDVHGHVMPQDTFTLRPENQGWAKLATLIRQARQGQANSLLVDCGDELQGEPLDYVRTVLHPDQPEPAIAIMNALGYTAMAVGNHEYNFGLPNLRGAEKQAAFPFLSANTLDIRTGRPAFKPYVITKAGPLTIAIVGFTTPWIPTWEEPANYSGLRFEDIVATAKTVIPKLRAKEKVDLVIVAMHSGLGKVDGRVGDENAALRLAEQVPGIDAILTGHTHQPISIDHKGVPILQASCWGKALGVLDFTLHKDPKGRWTVTARQAQLLKPDDATTPDAEVLSLTANIRGLTDRYLDTMATNLETDLDGRWGRMEDSPLVQLVQTVMRQATGAQLAAAACNNTRIFIPRGPTNVRQFYALEPYEDHVAVIRLTGAQLKAYLEHAARYFTYSWRPELFNPDIPGYDFDMVDGATYALDLGKPAGERVEGLSVGGQLVKPDQTFTLALTTYRLRGGGGYMDAMGFSGGPLSITDRSLRNLLLSYVLAHPDLSVTPDNNWRTIPYLDRERVLNLEK
ncbi:MAG TPA: bifunctional UDP-sugar hydrolase/5'-nucleotidase [Holophagaceae bacterium]|nr:bifunctional UDP-sugar hydrolase/5'-nucleotidase [Holophagaceae bacterium]